MASPKAGSKEQSLQQAGEKTASEKDPKGTPMLKQYREIKARHQDCILFFRLGDFYEMFYEDATLGARVLDLVLTSRGKGTSHPVPMCGVPHHSAENYIAKLIDAGYKVAICDQVEDPAQAKGIVKRDVTRIITTGTYLDENAADTRYLIALNPNGKSIGLSFIDPVRGTIQTNQYPNSEIRILEIIANLNAKECIYPESSKEFIKQLFAHPLLKTRTVTLSPFEDWCFNPEIAKKALCDHFAVHNLHGFGIEDYPAAIASTGALLEYLKQMNKQPLRHVDKISLYSDQDYCFISPAAYRGLELHSLIRTLDHTITALGKRKYYHWFTHPLKTPATILQRQAAVSLLKENLKVAEELETFLKQIPDVEKNISRLSCGYTHARDLLAIRNTLDLIPEIRKTIEPLAKKNNHFCLEDITKLRVYLDKTINEDIPLAHYEGKIIRQGINKELDELRSIQENGRQWLKDLQAKEIKRTGINSLKIGFNKVFGYYIEITKSNLKNAPAEYIRKQTLVNAERFITPELKEYEEKILTAQDKIQKIENDLIKEVLKEILDHSIDLHSFCESIATIDGIYSLAALANSPGYAAPHISEETTIDIKEGRHPVVEKTIEGDFVANDVYLDSDENHIIILTGPNMAGKSTYIRQCAILVLMAQVGSFLPAKESHIGIVDKVFTRIGAHDDISKGQSTFMVEMNEMADILNNMTDRSLVILDEIGRGTSTYDGLSLAWALAEHLKNTKARTMFATHFHELTALAEEHSGVKNFNVAVKEWKDEIIFLHKIVPGSTDDSYGIYVAKLAGIPQIVIKRAKHILTQLELKGDLKANLKGREQQIDLFSPANDPKAEKIKASLSEIDINNLTPVDALNRLEKLKQILESDE